jgi:hypothetical protein
MFVLVLNQSNIVPDGLNNKLVYKFPNSLMVKDKFIGVSNVTMYYSWFNITAAKNNNILTYTWTVAAATTTYTITIPDGLYEVSDINRLIQFTCINNGHYLINAVGQNIYYIELEVNANRYSVQLNTYLVPTSLPATFVQPSNFNGYPTQRFNPIVSIPYRFSEFIGFVDIGGVFFTSNNNVNNAYTPPTASKSNYYVTKSAIGTLSYLSNSYPNVQPNSSVLLSVSNVNNPYSQPSSIIYSLSPNVAIGELIQDKPPEIIWSKMIDGTYNEIRITLLGTDLQPLIIADPSITILLCIRDKDVFK